MNKLTPRYSDGDIIMMEGLENIGKEPIFELDMLVLILCDSGQTGLEIDGKEYFLSRGDLLICPPGVLISNVKDRGEGGLKLFGMKYSKVRHSMFKGGSIWSAMMFARNNPLFRLNEMDLDLTLSYYSVIKQKSATAKDFYYNEIMHSLMQCALYEICVIINREIAPGENDNIMGRKALIFKQFMEILATSDCKDRTVAEFARRLCISPKYLSAIVKDISGNSALEIILQNATEVIKRELEYSGKSIKEIADNFDFPNISVFGKFIKTRLGKSPREYRKNNNNFRSV